MFVFYFRFFSSSQNASISPPTKSSPTKLKSPDQTLKDVSNSSGPEVDNYVPSKMPEKLSDDKIVSLMEEELNDNTEEEKQTSKDKENASSLRLKHQNSFRWKSSLEDMYGFKNRKISSSPAVKNCFINPTRNESKVEKYATSSIEEVKKESQARRRNPFAKGTKLEFHSDSLGSQGSSADSDSQMETSSSEVWF